MCYFMIFLFGRGVPNETKGMINLNIEKKICVRV